MRLILFSLIAILYTSCGCNWHMKKIQRKCPLKSDTIVEVDTIVINAHSVDTIFKFSPLVQKDTMIIRENGVVIKYFYNTKDSTIFIEGKKEKEVRTVTKTVIRNVYNTKPPWWVGPLKWLLLILIIAVLSIFAFVKFRGRFLKIPLQK